MFSECRDKQNDFVLFHRNFSQALVKCVNLPIILDKIFYSEFVGFIKGERETFSISQFLNSSDSAKSKNQFSTKMKENFLRRSK